MTFVADEIASQAECWGRAAESAARAEGLPVAGERVAVVGCGTSWFMAAAYASLREGRGAGETDAFAASEFPRGRGYDRVVAITRSGTTTEVLELLAAVKGRVATTAITADAATPVREAADRIVELAYADERSVVQTRFATTALALLRAHLGEDLAPAVADVRALLDEELDETLVAAEQFTFLGTGWTVGLASEAALKFREASGAWTESYPAMEYRHGPISITGPGRVAWAFGPVPEGLAEQVAATGGRLVAGESDPLAQLVTAQRVAVARAEGLGLDPDRPRNLTRSVILR